MIILSLGYLTIPFDIKKSIKTLPSNDYVLQNTFTTLCIQGFVQSPPVMHPTIERHVIQLSPQATTTENETCYTLHQAFCKHQRHVYAIVPIANSMLGIVGATAQKDLFTIHIIEYTVEPVRNAAREDKILDLNSSPKPAEILKVCQSWPQSKPQLKGIANQIYNMALLYGYWENWQVFEGICQRYEINPQQFIGN
ncbi:unnamed protein product [Rhizopus stolonifer]